MCIIDAAVTFREDNQTKQVSLLSAANLPMKKEFIFRGQNFYYYGPQSETKPDQKAGVFVEFRNRQSEGLGLPLPRGAVRVYKKDLGCLLQFIGRDVIDHLS